MNLQRFTEIIEAYGGNPNHWPADERLTALEFKTANPEVITLIEESVALDRLLDSHTISEPDHAMLARQIQSQVAGTANPIDGFIRWLFPGLPTLHSVLRPVAVACLPVILGILIGYQGTSSDELSLEEELALLAVTYQVDDLEGANNEH